jgi:hypothetical protein
MCVRRVALGLVREISFPGIYVTYMDYAKSRMQSADYPQEAPLRISVK